MGAIMGRFGGQKESVPPGKSSPDAAAMRDQAILDARQRIKKLENTLGALMFGEAKNLTVAQQRWVDSARSKMTDEEASAFSRMKTAEEFYPLASELHRRTQEDPLTRYKPGT